VTRFPSLREAEGFSYSLFIRIGSGANPVFCTVGTSGSFPGAKVPPGSNADHLFPSNGKVKKE
jgi:hypothetical protein